jgi:hypothetical protein
MGNVVPINVARNCCGHSAEYERLKLFDAGKSSLSPGSAPKLFDIFQSEGKFLDRYFSFAYYFTCLQLSS